MLRKDFKKCRASAAGWDCWETEEWRHLSPSATDRLAQMLNAVEKGMPWPDDTNWGKAFFLNKTHFAATDPMDYRIILILSRLYRRWSTIRLGHVQKWMARGRVHNRPADVRAVAKVQAHDVLAEQ